MRSTNLLTYLLTYLNVFMVLKKLTSAGKLFDALITLTQNKLLRIPVLCGLKSLYLCLLVRETGLSLKMIL